MAYYKLLAQHLMEELNKGMENLSQDNQPPG
jgi:hypothetical protein